MTFRGALLAFVLASASLVSAPAPEASASVSVAATYQGLLRDTSTAVIATPIEQRSVWENGRIYTYTRVRVDRAVAGDLGTGAETWVQTMGGIVGNVGQHVDGEAVLIAGKSSLLFLHPGPAGAHVVTARAQGQFPVIAAPKAPARIMKSAAVGMLMAPKPLAQVPSQVPSQAPSRGGVTPQSSAPLPASSAANALAADVLDGRLVDDVVRDVSAAWKRAHGK